ncbi:hypothetical protein AHAS_Ahas15G0281300 [Arachis hypogaea]
MDPNGNEQPRRILGSYTAPTPYFYGHSIAFHGLPQEDPNLFIANFLQICDIVKTNGVNPKVYKLMLFPFAVRDRAKQWLDVQSQESLDTWDKVVNKFFNKFFPPQRLTKLRTDVQTFMQGDSESLYEACERYKLMLRKCPPNMFSD